MEGVHRIAGAHGLLRQGERAGGVVATCRDALAPDVEAPVVKAPAGRGRCQLLVRPSTEGGVAALGCRQSSRESHQLVVGACASNGPGQRQGVAHAPGAQEQVEQRAARRGRQCIEQWGRHAEGTRRERVGVGHAIVHARIA